MTITRIPPVRPGNGNPGIVPPWLITPIGTGRHAMQTQAITSNLKPVDFYGDMPLPPEWPFEPRNPGY